MSRARSFTRSEIMDAARAAAETGLCAKLCPTGEIIFTKDAKSDTLRIPSVEEEFEGWRSGREARGLA